MRKAPQMALLVMGMLVTSSLGAETTVKTVKYQDLANHVRSLKGKVVLVDFWRHD